MSSDVASLASLASVYEQNTAGSILLLFVLLYFLAAVVLPLLILWIMKSAVLSALRQYGRECSTHAPRPPQSLQGPSRAFPAAETDDDLRRRFQDIR